MTWRDGSGHQGRDGPEWSGDNLLMVQLIDYAHSVKSLGVLELGHDSVLFAGGLIGHS